MKEKIKVNKEKYPIERNYFNIMIGSKIKTIII